MTMTELTSATLEGESVLRRAALHTLLRRATQDDPELLTEGVRLLSQQTRETLFLFFRDLVAATFEALRNEELSSNLGAGSPSSRDLPTATLRTACLAIDDAHRALAVYAPVEAILLTLFLSIGTETGGEGHVA